VTGCESAPQCGSVWDSADHPDGGDLEEE
jgi:hypothetical protein